MRDCGGFRMGPFELMDLIGHDVNFSVTQSVFAAYYGDPRFPGSPRRAKRAPSRRTDDLSPPRT